MRDFRGVATAAVGALSLLVLAACGPLGSSASGGDKKTAAPASSAPTKAGSSLSGPAHAFAALDLVKKATGTVHSAKVESNVSIGSAMSMTSKGAVDWADGLQGAMSITYTGGSMADTLRSQGLPATVQARYLTDAYYANMGPKMASQLGGRHWIRYGYDELAKIAGGSGAFMKDAVQNNSPSKSLDVILASPDVRSVGQETVRGVVATHYTGTVDAAAVTRQSAPNLTAAELADLEKNLAKAGITTETVDVWVSKDDLPVKAVTNASTKTGNVSSTVYYSDFGTPVNAAAPAAYDTVDIMDLAKRQQAA
jgi:hypothetical protein